VSLTPLNHEAKTHLQGVDYFLSSIYLWLKATLTRLWALDTRALEMAIGLSIGLRGIFLMVNPDLMKHEFYSALDDMMSPSGWMLLCILASSLQISGIIINGHWSKSPWLRFTGALISATFFAMVSTLYLMSIPPISLTASVLIPLAIANLWTAINIASKS
jgi:hypothetical protein